MSKVDTVRSHGIQLLADKRTDLQLFTLGDVVDRNTKWLAKYVLADSILVGIAEECTLDKEHITPCTLRVGQI